MAGAALVGVRSFRLDAGEALCVVCVLSGWCPASAAVGLRRPGWPAIRSRSLRSSADSTVQPASGVYVLKGAAQPMGGDMDESFERFVADEGPSLLRFAAALIGDRGTAEEVVQEVLFRASRRWAVILATGAHRAYLRRMVINEHVSWRRKWARLVPRDGVLLERVQPDHAGQYAERDALSRELDKLPPRQRAVLVLRYYEGLSDEAIAELLGCSHGTVRSHASRALAALRIELSTPLAGAAPTAKD